MYDCQTRLFWWMEWAEQVIHSSQFIGEQVLVLGIDHTNSVSLVLLLSQVRYRLLMASLQLPCVSCIAIMGGGLFGIKGMYTQVRNWGNRSLCLVLIILEWLTCSAVVSGQLWTYLHRSLVALHFLWCNHGRMALLGTNRYVHSSQELGEQALVFGIDHTRVTNLFCYCIRSVAYGLTPTDLWLPLHFSWCNHQRMTFW